MKRKMKKTGIAALIVLMILSSMSALAADPTWTTKASMSTARWFFQTETVNGEIYAIGGLNENGTTLASTEVYDPATDTWTTLASMNTARHSFQTEVINGKIYAFGGHGSSSGILSSTEVYDPANNTWTNCASMSVARYNHKSAVIDGKIYVIGGSNETHTLSSVEVYDPSANTWTTLASMNTVRYKMEAKVIDGKIYAFGGGGINTHLSSLEVYDPNTNTWTALASMLQARYSFCAEVIDGNIYAFGGANNSGSSVEVYDLVNNTWTTIASMSRRSAHSSVVYDGKAYVMGGNDVSAVEVYDPSTDTWTAIASLSAARNSFKSEILDGTIYVIGGATGGVGVSSVEAYTVISEPSAPTLSATAGDAQVALSWNTVADAASYNVYRATTSGGPYSSIATGVTGTSYTDSGLTNGTTYYYVVTAVNSSGLESAYSNEVSATPTTAGNALLRIHMITGVEKEYSMTASQINAFITWFNGGAADSPTFIINKDFNLGPFTSRRDYLVYDKIVDFEIFEY